MNDFLRRFFPSKDSPPSEKTYPPVPKRPDESADERAALDEAERWLDTATLRDARAFSLGEERIFNVDQDKGRLVLHHADRSEVKLSIQILASFRPQDRSLRWSWANSSIDPALTTAVRAMRDSPSTASFVSVRTPTFEAKFEDCVRLVALAAKLGGCDGAYRCITDNNLSVFVGYKAPPAKTLPPIADAEARAVALLDAYDAEMFPIDEAHHRKERGLDGDAINALMEALLAEKLAIYRRYWRRDDAYWEPCSFGWPSEHAPSERLRRFALPRRAGGIYVVAQKNSVSTNAYVVESFDDGPRITDMDLDWGKGLLLARRT